MNFYQHETFTYVHKMNLDDNMIQKSNRVFQDSGKAEVTLDDFCNFELSAKYLYDEFLTKNPHLPPSRSAPSGKNGGRTPLRSLVFSLSLCCRDVSVRTSAHTTVRAAVCTQPTKANLITVICHLCCKERSRTKS